MLLHWVRDHSGLPLWIVVGLVVVDAAVKIVAIGLVPEQRLPSSASAWLLLILFLPFVGIGLYLLIGSPFVDRRRRGEQDLASELIRASEVRPSGPALDEGAPAYLRHAVALNHTLGCLPEVGNNATRVYADYDESIAAMAAEVATAERYVHVTFYIMSWDSTTDVFFSALADAARRGVRVRLLFDHVGTLRIPGFTDLKRRLDEAGIEWHAMLPVQPLRGKWQRPDLRNHRKIVIVDGRSAFTGSQNMIHPSYHNKAHEKAGRQWRDLMVRTRGPVVHSLNLVFATDWYLETGRRVPDLAPETFPEGNGETLCQVIPSGPGFPNENNLRLFNTLIYGARHRLSITSPYFVPDESLLHAVTTAAQRGVQVELFVSEQGDQFAVDHAQRSYYRDLLEAGVRIRQYPVPAVLHAKHMSVDDQVAVIGSSNMDIRSFLLDFEVSVMYVGPELLAGLRAVEDRYRSRSVELTLEDWRRRPLRRRYLDNVMRLTSALQ